LPATVSVGGGDFKHKRATLPCRIAGSGRLRQ
jgi:hypothetical protein